ncbi:MAG: TIGR03557 family F420-dependent LLM class oxidoreductase [Anaerolineaceae bacterium]|jgi:G6PDH family F420-dependent oxidoreductase|nr:TIGR03557 family F420-dependent LLM class oxidoreductase [Anaerolineaceae bacterium]
MKQNIRYGYNLSSEEHPPHDLIKNAQRAEKLGFDFVMISDHYHPWLDVQGHSPFVWSMIGAIAQATSTIRLGTGVTCPIMRIHPAIIAQAAATSAALMEGRFFLGLGSGENLNEHILGDHWPTAPIRLEMLEEAVEVIRLLWEGEEASYYGEYFTVENARIYTLPDELPDMYIASGGDISAEIAGEMGDGLIALSPDQEVLNTFDESGGKGKPKIGKLDVCWAASEEQARKVVHKQWANTGVPGQLNVELATTTFIEQAASLVTEEQATEHVICGPDPEKLLAEIRKYAQAGFDHIYFHQIGPDQDGFFKFYEKEIRPKLQSQ